MAKAMRADIEAEVIACAVLAMDEQPTDKALMDELTKVLSATLHAFMSRRPRNEIKAAIAVAALYEVLMEVVQYTTNKVQERMALERALIQ